MARTSARARPSCRVLVLFGTRERHSAKVVRDFARDFARTGLAR